MHEGGLRRSWVVCGGKGEAGCVGRLEYIIGVDGRRMLARVGIIIWVRMLRKGIRLRALGGME